MRERFRQGLAAGKEQAGGGIGVEQILAQTPQLRHRGSGGRCLPRGIGQHALQVIQYQQGGVICQGTLHGLQGLAQVGVLRHRPVGAFRQHLPTQTVQHAAHIADRLQADKRGPAKAARAHQPARQFHGQRGLAHAALPMHHRIGVVMQQPLQGQQFTTAPLEMVWRRLGQRSQTQTALLGL